MGAFRCAIYGIIFGCYAYTLLYDIKDLPRFGVPSWTNKLLMLTILNLVLQTCYSAICLICSLLDWRCELAAPRSKRAVKSTPSYWRTSRWHSICDFIYFTSAFPVGLATCFLYWTLFSLNPEHVMPSWIAKFIPSWYNQMTHTAPIFFLLTDTLLTCHHAPQRWIGSLTVLALFAFYAGLVVAVNHFQGYWLYPILELLTVEYRCLLFALAFVLLWFLYLIGDGLNSMLWGTASHVRKQTVKVA